MTHRACAADLAVAGVNIGRVDNDAAVNAARAEGMKAGAADERARILAIMSSDEAQGREALALAICTNTDLVVDQAMALLRTLPRKQTTRTKPSRASRSGASRSGLVGSPAVSVGPQAARHGRDDD